MNASYMVNHAGQRVCHRNHVMKQSDIYIENKKDGRKLERCKTCRKEAQQRFKEKRPQYFINKNKQFKATQKYILKAKQDRAKYRTQWIAYFVHMYGKNPRCALCDKKLFWTHKEHGLRACFDHRSGREIIKSKSPRTWIQNKPCNEKNKNIFHTCNFGILCRACNLLLPGNIKQRKKIIKNIMIYLEEGLS